MDAPFSFEKLDIYKRALAFAQKVQNVNSEAKGHYSLRDQIDRASTSIVLNIAEGSGRWHEKDKKNFYYIARGSAFECVPLLDLCCSFKIITDEQRIELRADLMSISQMLTKLIQSVGGSKK